MLELISLLLPTVTRIINAAIPDPIKQAEVSKDVTEAMLSHQVEIEKIVSDRVKAQAAVNEREAQNPSLFVAGWRPFIGWVGGFALVYSFLIQPLAAWVSAMLAGPVPPPLETQEIIMLITGMLGLGAFRTFEKSRGVDTARLGKRPVLKRD